MVLASDLNSGLWIFRVTADTKGGNGGGSAPGGPGSGPGGAGSGAGQPATPLPQAAPDQAANRADEPGRLGGAGWIALAGLALGLLAAGAVVRNARRRQHS
jgi:hypothetical protein